MDLAQSLAHVGRAHRLAAIDDLEKRYFPRIGPGQVCQIVDFDGLQAARLSEEILADPGSWFK